MSKGLEIYADAWGSILGFNDNAHIEIHWTESTSTMSGDAFKTWLLRFADLVVENSCETALVDARQFRMKPDGLDMGWRDREIIPRYNNAGLAKFAFVMPAGMPAIGAPPTPEGPADFPTAFFATYEDALAWLES